MKSEFPQGKYKTIYADREQSKLCLKGAIPVRYHYGEHPVHKKVFTSLWACPRQLTKGWGCPTILERMEKFLDEKPDIYFGLTDGINDDNAITVDINPENHPTVVADWDNLPFRDGAFRFSFWDPPYDRRYVKGLKEILRVTSKRVAILHQLIYPNPKGWVKKAIIGVTTGPNMRIRCLQIYDRGTGKKGIGGIVDE